MAKAEDTNSKQFDGQSNPHPFIDSNDAYTAYHEAFIWNRPYMDPMDEFERLARNKPQQNIPTNLPRITDGTLAALIQEQPKRIIQQLATGTVKSRDYPAEAMIADLVHRNFLLPAYTRNGTALQKHWNMLSKSLTWGRSASYTFWTSTNGVFHTDFVIPYVKDVLTEKGKVYAPDSNVVFLRSWYQKRDLQSIINREKWLVANRKGYTSDWDLVLLAEFMNQGQTAKPGELLTPAEKEKGDGYAGGYEVIHAFQKGKKAEFYSFSPRFQQGKNLRTKINKDPRGAIPIDFEYCNIDLSNPFGRGTVELSGGIQNMMDQKLQMNQYLMALLMAPPLMAYGNVNKSSLKFRPNAIWDMGSSPSNKIEPYTVNNEAITGFVGDMQFLQSKIYNLNATQDSSVPANANSTGKSKTDAGVNMQKAQLGIADNYLEKQHEAWFGAQSESSINQYFAEMNSTETVDVGPIELEQLSGTVAEKFINQKTGKLVIDYSKTNDVSFEFRTDAGSSQNDDDAAQLEIINQMLTEYNQNALVMNWSLGTAGYRFNAGELQRQQFEKMGLKNLDIVLSKIQDPQELQAAQQAPFPIIDKPQIRLTGKVPDADMGAALAAGGVHVDPHLISSELDNYKDIIADPSTPISIKEQIWKIGGLQADPNDPTLAAAMQGQSGQDQPTTPSTDPAQLALKNKELDIKQQVANQGDARLQIEAHKAAHQTTMDTHRAAEESAFKPVQMEQQNQQQQAALDAKSQSVTNSPNPSPTGDSPQEQQQDQSQGTQPGTLQDIEKDLGGTPNPGEQALIEHMLTLGYSESDVEQGITMIRSGRNPAEVMQILAAKYSQGATA